MSVAIEEEPNIKFKNSAIADLKARGVHAFSNACNALVVNAFNELTEKQLSPPYKLFHISSMQPAA